VKKIKLFCFPYAGGSSMIYNKWRLYLDQRIELIPVELAGRGKRMKEDFYLDTAQAIGDLFTIIRPHIRNSKYAFFGHSMGTILAHELCHKLIEAGEKEPEHLFVSGRYPPSIHKIEDQLSSLSDNEFLQKIYEIGGTDKEILHNKELSDLFVPIIKADYRMVEEYEYVDKVKRYNSNLTAFTGSKDTDVTYDNMLEWKSHTSGSFEIFEFDGGHFFINVYTKEIVDIINSRLLNYLN
jgi:surfactin synthase thioesterase subunit